MSTESGPKVFPVKRDPETGRLEYINPADEEGEFGRLQEEREKGQKDIMGLVRALDDAALRKKYEESRTLDKLARSAPNEVHAYIFYCLAEVMKERDLLDE